MSSSKQLILALIVIVAIVILSGFTRTTRKFTTQGQTHEATCLYYWDRRLGCITDWHPDDEGDFWYCIQHAT